MNSNTLLTNRFAPILIILIIFAGCGARNTSKENTNWQDYYNIGDSLLNRTDNKDVRFFAELEDGVFEQVFEPSSWEKDYMSFINIIQEPEIKIYINIPYSESGDWDNELIYIYDKEGELKVLIRKSSFFNSECVDGILTEKEVFANETGQIKKKMHTVLDENNKILKDTVDCVFNYRFKYPVYLNYSDIPVVIKNKDVLK